MGGGEREGGEGGEGEGEGWERGGIEHPQIFGQVYAYEVISKSTADIGSHVHWSEHSRYLEHHCEITALD